jgi:TolB protein
MRLKITLPLLIAAFFWLIIPASRALSQSPEPAERLAMAAYSHGQWDIFTMAPDGSGPRQLTNDPHEDTDPAYSPDGTQLAYASRRSQNWDVYVLNLQTGQETRLTSSPHYDGAPAWSPDGQTVAYESYHNGDLDIWLIDAAGAGPPLNLTADSEAGDFGPAWRPDGQAIAFASWRADSTDLYLLDLESGSLTRLTDSPAAELEPAWSADGQQLVFTQDNLGDRELFLLNAATPAVTGATVQPVTWLGRTDNPAWSPDGQAIAAVYHRWDGDTLITHPPESGPALPRQLTQITMLQGRPAWHNRALNAGQPVGPLNGGRQSPFSQEQLTPNDTPNAEPYNMIRLNDIKTGTPWLADTVDDSFQDWRAELRTETGYDFFSELSDALRDVAGNSETSQYASWHKSGRAIDTLFDYHLNGQLAHEIGREDYNGETYWRIYLRCVDQSGACGQPLTANPWNYSSRARTEIAPDQGGIEKAIPPGYYVDMTAAAQRYGWQRISSYDDEEYSWTWHFLAFEYWHYQNRLAAGPLTAADSHPLKWYQAMRDVYPEETLTRYFTWEKMRAVDENPHLIALKGVPLPLDVRPWWVLAEAGAVGR